MNTEYSILFQKQKSGAVVKDLFDDFGFVCTSVPFDVSGETKDLPTRSYPEVDGDDVYIPDVLPLKSFDTTISVAYKGIESYAVKRLTALVGYLRGLTDTGARLKMYSSYTMVGRKDCYLKEVGEPTFRKDNGYEHLQCKLKFHVCDPVTLVTPTYTDNTVTSLG